MEIPESIFMRTSNSASWLAEPTLVTEQAWGPDVVPVVSVLCIAFNHERFIRQCLDGFLMQRTAFPIEIVVHDDASTDSTAAIIREYAARHEGLIRPILQKENQHSKGELLAANLFGYAQAPYVALCEGDDFWTSPDKLQQQILLLEEHSEASGCIHRADGHFEETGEIISGHFGPEDIKPRYTVDDLLASGNFVPTASIVFRRNALRKLPAGPHGDFLMLVEAARSGPLLYIDQSMAAYRKHAGGIHSAQSTAIQISRALETLFVIASQLGLAERPAYQEGVKFRLKQMEEAIVRYEKMAAEHDELHRRDQQTMSGILNSRTFKMGRALTRCKNRVWPHPRA